MKTSDLQLHTRGAALEAVVVYFEPMIWLPEAVGRLVDNLRKGQRDTSNSTAEKKPNMGIDDWIQIVKGTYPRPRGRWYTLGLPISRSVTLYEQLDAIRDLGNSGSSDALTILKSVRRSESKCLHRQESGAEHYTTYYEYPHVNGPLRKRLEYHVADGYDYVLGKAVPHKAEHWERDHVTTILNQAIQQLEEAVQGESHDQ